MDVNSCSSASLQKQREFIPQFLRRPVRALRSRRVSGGYALLREALAAGAPVESVMAKLPGRTPRAVRKRYDEMRRGDKGHGHAKVGDGLLEEAIARGDVPRELAKRVRGTGRRDAKAVRRRMRYLLLRKASEPSGERPWTRGEDASIVASIERGVGGPSLADRAPELVKARRIFLKHAHQNEGTVRWTPEEDEVLRSGKSWPEMLEALPGRTRVGINTRRWNVGIVHRRTKWSDAEDELLRKVMAQATSWQEARQAFDAQSTQGFTNSTIRSHRRLLGLMLAPGDHGSDSESSSESESSSDSDSDSGSGSSSDSD
jgi:hypothetical protein